MTWYALLAISSLSEHPVKQSKLPIEPKRNPYPVNDQQHRTAISWYSKALSEALAAPSNTREGIEKSATGELSGKETSRALLSCLLFTAIELQLGNASNALALIQRGFAIAGSRSKENLDRSTHAIESEVLPVLLRLALPLAIFGQKVPDPFRDAAKAHKRRISRQMKDERLRELRARLYDVLYEAQIFLQDVANLRPQENQQRQEGVLKLMTAWWAEFSEAIQPYQDKADTSPQILILGMRTLYQSMFIQISCALDETHMLVDDFKDTFTSILDDAEELLEHTKEPQGDEPSFSIEIGLVGCMYSVAWHCRHPALRRRALDILRRAPAQESLWTSNATLKIAEQVIALEEGAESVASLDTGSEPSLPDESMRLHADFSVSTSMLPRETDQDERMLLVPHEARTILRRNSDGSSALVFQACREDNWSPDKNTRVEERQMFCWT